MKMTNLFMLGAACLAGATVAANAEEPLRMFVDDHHIHEATGVTRELGQPVKRPDPIFTGNGAWDANPYTFGSVIYDEDAEHFKMWYQTFNMGEPIPTRSYVLYATSDDGIDWHRPNLGLHEAGGSTDNNIILKNSGFGDIYSPSVIKDANPSSPDQKYKMIFFDKSGPETYGDGGLFTAFSPDGINWERQQETPLLQAAKQENSISDVMDVMYDEASGKYVAYAKGWADPFPDHRQIVRIESEDFVNWSEPEVVITHDRTPEDQQSYGMPVFEYEGLYLGLMRSYKDPGDATIDIQLKVSRDNHSWEDVAGHETFIPTGADGTWDDGMIFTAPPMVHDDEVLIYYGAWDGPHNTSNRAANIGLATLPVGRLAGMRAAAEQGIITTTAFTLEHGHIELNANAEGGTIRAAVLDEHYQAFEGFGFDDFEVLTTDELAYVMSWSGGDLAELEGQQIHVRFELTGDATLYGFRPVTAPSPASAWVMLLGGAATLRRNRFDVRRA